MSGETELVTYRLKFVDDSGEMESFSMRWFSELEGTSFDVDASGPGGLEASYTSTANEIGCSSTLLVGVRDDMTWFNSLSDGDEGAP